jgi:uncharacterized protein YndB with AHSA1/START domain
MSKGRTAQASIEIEAPVSEVWRSLTDPTMIRQYFFGTEVTSDWQEGSPIIYRGTWKNQSYEDKGMIEKIVPNQLLQSTYWSSMSGTEDKPENYATVSYRLRPAGKTTVLEVTQDNCPTEESQAHSQANWKQVLTQLKDLLEKA